MDMSNAANVLVPALKWRRTAIACPDCLRMERSEGHNLEQSNNIFFCVSCQKVFSREEVLNGLTASGRYWADQAREKDRLFEELQIAKTTREDARSSLSLHDEEMSKLERYYKSLENS